MNAFVHDFYDITIHALSGWLGSVAHYYKCWVITYIQFFFINGPFFHGFNNPLNNNCLSFFGVNVIRFHCKFSVRAFRNQVSASRRYQTDSIAGKIGMLTTNTCIAFLAFCPLPLACF